MSNFTNSSLVTKTKLTPRHYNPRTRNIGGITIHMNAGVCTVDQLLDFEYNTTRSTS